MEEQSDLSFERMHEREPTWEGAEEQCRLADARLDDLPPILKEFNEIMTPERYAMEQDDTHFSMKQEEV